MTPLAPWQEGDLCGLLAVLTSSHEIAKLNEKLKSLAYSDGLTGTWNRCRMEQAIDAELNAAERHDRPFAVLLFDIDHFNRFNDIFGHEASDHGSMGSGVATCQRLTLANRLQCR